MKSFLLKNSIIILFLFSITLAASSSIRGKITDSKSGQQLMGANIMLEDTNLGGASDENGNYLIENIPIGRYTLHAMYMGYTSLKEEIWIEANREYIIDIKLKPSAIELDETKVTAEKRKEKITGAPASIEIVTSRDIKGKTTTNMGAYLKGLKGIDFTSSGINNYSISVRGFNSSFNTRLLTLSDGRVANIPALRVINYSTIPQSMDDVDKIEVVLGPATALYGANAHSGVVNIISKPPSLSEGLSMSISGSNDELQLRKINGRFAKKLSKSLSFKISGLYLHAYDWPFISEEEYKAHRYPWSLTPGRVEDMKDNNPGANPILETNIFGDEVRIGDGEPMDTGDPDGDGVMGEDWFNGYDDDGDCMSDSNQDGCYCCSGDIGVDEDYFIANGIDDDNDCPGDTNNDGIYCGPGDEGVDEGIDDGTDFIYDGYDNDNNGVDDDEAGEEWTDSNIKYWGGNIENDILVQYGRRNEFLKNGDPNPYFIDSTQQIIHDLPDPELYPAENAEINFQHLMGDHRYNEEAVVLEFDIFNYDFGIDGLPGDPYLDKKGDYILQIGECLNIFNGFDDFSDCDCGLDGIPNTGDFGEMDGIWQPGDGWVDDGDGIVELGTNNDPQDFYTVPDENDVGIWPPINGLWDEGETIYDCGNDGYCWDDSWTIGEPYPAIDIYGIEATYENGDPIYVYGPDPGENDGTDRPWDYEENDGIFDIGDEIYGFQGEEWIDCNGTICEGDPGWEEGMGNGRWDSGEKFTDINGDNMYTPPDLIDNYQIVLDKDGDGMTDYPDFEILNRKIEFRLDFDPNPDFNLTFQSGYSWTKTQQVTGTGRYLADGFEYRFSQIRGRYKNWFAQVYRNKSFSGDTRGYNLGNHIIDESKNYAAQIQNNFNIHSLHTKFVWGTDYFRTEPFTDGTIINDGPNGYDNNGNNVFLAHNGQDDDGNCPGDTNEDGCVCCSGDEGVDESICPDGGGPGFRNGKIWRCGEGIDEPDEFVDPLSNEYGIYYQSTTELFGTSRYELITAARLDYHDLLAEGLLFAPKIGFIYKPDSKSSFRITYGKAHNTPNSISLYTDLFIGSIAPVFDVYLRGNKDGNAYCRVGDPCLGQEYPTSIVEPGFYSKDRTFYTFGNTDEAGSYFSYDGYRERVDGAPYFYNFGDEVLPVDMLPLDTSRYVIYVPALVGDGVLYTPEESINLPDVEAIKTEKIQTLELGYKGFLGNKTHFSLDYYLSFYEDFFSPPTVITPWVIKRKFDNQQNYITTVNNIDNEDIIGIMTINDVSTYPPYATAFNGLDEDGDWIEWADEFGWWDDDNQDGNPMDPGEWGFVTFDSIWYHPYEVLEHNNGTPTFQFNGAGKIIDDLHGQYFTVGIDEWHNTSFLDEHEIPSEAISANGTIIPGIGKASAPYDIVLSPMNYGEVWMQGIDFGMTHFISEKLIFDGNVSWYGTTEFYNELTRRNDPINAPEWKWNTSLKWNSNLGDMIINLRHVNQFAWNDGLFVGIIGPYNILDFFYSYKITKNLELNISALNLNNDRHKELIGGAIMGRQIIMRLTSTF